MLLGSLTRRDDESRAFASPRPIDAKSEDLSRAGQTYVRLVAAAGTAAIICSLIQLASGPITYQWLILASLTLFSGLLSIRIPSLGARISASETFVFALALLFGPAPATLTVAIDGLLVSLGLAKRGLYRTFFNMAEPAISVWMSSNCFYLLTGVEPLFGRHIAVGQIFLPLLAMTTAYFVLNSGLIAGAVAFETRISPIQFLRANGPHLSLNYFASVCLVVLVVQNAANLHFAAAGVIVPLLVMSYFSSKTSIGRVEDTNRHLADLNKLYLSTAQTLAMAIDAKDEVTHGHIRRVQAYALGLARALNVTDRELVRAIEAGALLHDTGKLAVPEYILNKPGKLTPPEFERMKLHAKVGADIISAIGFPYPVVPIVRHHHENWDGTGYPDGLSGADIPLGARILSVVDCFDALTSDRPYRTRLSEEQALDILRERRGTMYDPEVVDTFIAVHRL
jgi:putative nucleotidyltransferase with HDIG domain